MPSDFLFLILFLSPQCPTQDPHSRFKIRPPLGCWTLLFWAFFISASLHAHPCMLVSLSSISGPLPSVRLWRGCHTHFRALYHWRIPSLPWQLLSLMLLIQVSHRHTQLSLLQREHIDVPLPLTFGLLRDLAYLVCYLGVQAVASELLLDSFLSLTS